MDVNSDTTPFVRLISSIFGSEADVSECDVQEKCVALDQFWQEFLTFYVSNNVSLACLENVAKLVNKLPGTQLKIPETKYLILQKFRENSDIPFEFYINCQNCNLYTVTNPITGSATNCSQCEIPLKPREMNFFVYINIENQLRGIIRKYWTEIFAYINKNSRRNSTCIRDIIDGNVIKELNGKESKTYNLTLLMNTDGANVFESNTQSLWPIQFYLNFLPPSHRFIVSNIIVGALYFGEKKPDVLNFFLPLAKEIQDLQRRGIVVEIGEVEWTFNIYLTQGSFDLPAKATMQQLMQYNGSYGCSYCLHPGESIKNQKGISRIKYTWSNVTHNPRTNYNVLKTMEKMEKRKKSNLEAKHINGVKGLSCMVAFKHFDLVNSFCLDYMHNVILGVFKAILRSWLSSAHARYYLKKNARITLDKRLLSILKCSFISRRTRSLQQLPKMKACELRSLLLFYLPICISGLLPKKYVDHLRLLSKSIHSLLKTEIDFNELNTIEIDLNRFVKEYQDLYGKSAMTMNVHLISHLVQNVRNNGPLWSTSMFGFESSNGHLVKLFHGNTDVLQQMSLKYILKHISHVKEPSKPIEKSFTFCAPKIITLNQTHLKVLNDMQLPIQHDAFPIFTALNIGTEKYTSIEYTRAKKSCDYVIRFNNTKYGKICFFFKFSNLNLMMIQQLEITEKIDHILKVYHSNFVIVEVTEVNEKLVHYNMNDNSFISSRPNPYEKD